MKFKDSLVTLVGEIKEQLTNKESDVPLQARFPYLAIMWQRYQVLDSKIDKTKMLDEASAVTRLNRCYLNRVFRANSAPKRETRKRKRESKYISIVPLIKDLWKRLNYCAGKKMCAAMLDWVPSLDANLAQMQLLYKISAAEIDRLLKPIRAERRRRLNTGTFPSKHKIKTEVPIKPLGKNPEKPGFLEIDTVAHCGESLSGHFFWTLTAVDIHTRWTTIKEYLTAVIEWRHKISKENATEWFPHNYKKQLAEVQKEFAQNEGLLPYRICKKRTKSPELEEETSPDWGTDRETPQLQPKNHANSTKAQPVN